MRICTSPRCEHTSKALRYGTHSQGISQFYMHTPHSSVNGMNHTCLCLPSRSWSSCWTTSTAVFLLQNVSNLIKIDAFGMQEFTDIAIRTVHWQGFYPNGGSYCLHSCIASWG